MTRSPLERPKERESETVEGHAQLPDSPELTVEPQVTCVPSESGKTYSAPDGSALDGIEDLNEPLPLRRLRRRRSRR